MRSIGRSLVAALGGLLVAAGGLALALAYLPEHALVATLRQAIAAADTALPGLPAELPVQFEVALSSAWARFAAAPFGVVVLLAALLPGRSARPGSEPTGNPGRPVAAPRVLRKTQKRAAAAAKKGQPGEAAELCLAVGRLDTATGYFIQAGDLVRAAEVRHEQGRLLEAAELHLEAENFEVAARIFSDQQEFARAGEACLRAGNQTVAAEMFETARDYRRAAECFAAAGFLRQAAEAYALCEAFEPAARCLDQVIREESAGFAGADPRKHAELDKLVRMAGYHYERAGLYERAQTVLEKGGCHLAAAEIAAAHGSKEKAAELFLQANEAARAARVLNELGDNQRASLVLAEYHRDRGESEEAAGWFEQAGELLTAGDLYRSLDQHVKAGECYERQGDGAQAGEMFRAAGDPLRAAQNYERARLFSEAAECYALAGDGVREAQLLCQAGQHLRASEIHRHNGRNEEAIKMLQQVGAESPDWAAASALLGEIFRERGMHSLAIKKLTHAVGDRELGRETVQAFYSLARAYEADEQLQEASELYEKLLAFDYQYADVAQRLEQTREQLERQRSASSSASQGSSESPSAPQGRYRILSTLGRGGMGIVYKAEDTVLDRTVAFKVLPQSLKENPQALKNFLREAKSAARLNHPNIVTVYDAGEQEGVYYIAMEYVDGHTLKEIVKHRGRISSAGVVNVLAQMCEALAYAHEKKIVHRDIKTANTMWTRERQAKIMDFGLAKVIEEVRNHTTVVSGTPYYMSPEQTLGKNVDHRTDIYSLGVTMFELATGMLPFREGNLPYHHVHTPPPDPREFASDLPPLLAELILRCLRKDPAERYPSTRDVLREIRDSAGG